MKNQKQNIPSNGEEKFSHEREIILNAFNAGDFVRWKDLEDLGVRTTTIARMIQKGELEKQSWGTYRLSEHLAHKEEFADEQESMSSEIEGFAEVAIKAPKGIICLMSAVSYYKITEDMPHQVWLALPHGQHAPRMNYPPIRAVFWRNPLSLETGIETIEHLGVKIKITSPERTVVDLYRHRNSLADPNIAKKALVWYMSREDCDRDKLSMIADIMKVTSQIRADIEMLDVIPTARLSY